MATRSSHHPLALPLVGLLVTLLGSGCGGASPEPTPLANETEQAQPLTGELDDNIVLVGNTVYMRKASTGDIYTYDTAAHAWQMIGGPGKQFVGTGSALYGITPDGKEVGRYKNNQWTKVGGAATTLYAGGAGLLGTNPPSGDVYAYSESGNTWQKIGGPGYSFAVGQSAIVGIRPNRDHISQYSGTPLVWNQIGGAAGTLYVGATRMYSAAIGSGGLTGDIYRYDGVPESWTYVGGPGRAFAVVGDTLFKVDPAGSVYMNQGGTDWSFIGGPVERIYGGTGSLLCARISATWGAACYDVNTQKWSMLDQP